MSGRLPTLVAALSERFFPRPIDTVEALGRFVGQRAAYVAQTSLYGYLKTRMGTTYPRYFQDPAFAALIRTAAVRLFVSCAADLAVHGAAAAGEGRLAAAESSALARCCFAAALRHGLAAADAAAVPAGSSEAFAARVAGTDWAEAARGEAAFADSVADLLRVAPVTDEFKALDRPIVRNSMRFAWRDVRAQLRRRLDPGAVCADWRSRPGGSDPRA